MRVSTHVVRPAAPFAQPARSSTVVHLLSDISSLYVCTVTLIFVARQKIPKKLPVVQAPGVQGLYSILGARPGRGRAERSGAPRSAQPISTVVINPASGTFLSQTEGNCNLSSVRNLGTEVGNGEVSVSRVRVRDSRRLSWSRQRNPGPGSL